MSGLPTVILLLETSIEYGRGLLRGIVKYERLYGPWSIHVSAGHFQHSLPPVQPSGSASVGVIARLASLAEAETIVSSAVPAIALESSLEEPELAEVRTRLHEIRSNSPEIGRIGADYLVGLGLSRLAYCGFRRCPWSQTREHAFRSQANTHGFTSAVYAPPTGKGEPWEHDLQHLGDWLKALPKPVGVMACNDMCGRQVLQACADRGLRVPDEVSVVGVDNDEMLCELADPPMSSIALDLEGAGYAAAVLLDEAMTGRATEGRQVVPVDPVKVVERRSTQPVLQADPLVADALRYLRDHAGRLIGVPDISSHVGVSRRTLERRFRSALGCSLHDELTRCRLERAKRLLRETDLPAYRVAEAAGFGNIQPMMRLFRRKLGCTPSDWRRLARESIP
jgi:LacI family transcriptional regulator